MTDNRLHFFKQVNAYFDKVMVVSIPRLKDRQAYMSELLEGLDFEFVQGVDREQLSGEEINRVYEKSEHLRLSRFKKTLRPGEIACALSHMQAYQRAIDQGFGRILILEDDVNLIEKNLRYFNQFSQNLPSDWEMVYLGYWKNEKATVFGKVKQAFYSVLSLLGLHKWSFRRHLNTYPKQVNEHVLTSGNHEGAYAYALTLDGCRKLLDFNRPIKLNADHLFSHLVTNEKLKGYLAARKFFEPMPKDGEKYFGSETNT